MNNEDNMKNVISFSVSADQEVEQDFITITFHAVEGGKDPQEVQNKLAEKLNAALDIAKAKKVPGAVDVRTGNFQISPMYDKKQKPDGYRGQVQMVVSGTDTKTVAGLTGEISTMVVAGIEHSISDALRKQVTADLGVKAITLWREKGDTYIAAFGAKGSEVINASISVDNNHYYRRAPRAMAMSASMEAVGGGVAVSEEGGTENLTGTVNGSIQLQF